MLLSFVKTVCTSLSTLESSRKSCQAKGEFLVFVPLLDVCGGTLCETGGAISRHLKRIVDDQVLNHETQAPLFLVA